jgi:hypothetical protein
LKFKSCGGGVASHGSVLRSLAKWSECVTSTIYWEKQKTL